VRAVALAAIFAASGALGACDPQHHNVRELRREVERLEKRIERLHDQMEKRAEVLQGYIYDLAAAQPPAVAALEPGNPAYSRIEASGATFLVSLDKVAPYADGQRVTISIGNPSAVTFRDPKLRVEWGRRFSGGDRDSWRGGLKSKSETILKGLRPGSWNPVTVVLSPATPEEVGYIGVAVETGAVALAR
jgi:hypothetical protein